MMANAVVCLAVVVALVAALVAYFASRRDEFTVATPATPLVREEIGSLFATLQGVARLAQQFETRVSALPADVAAMFAGARRSAAQLSAASAAVKNDIYGLPPTYVNYLAVYRGLAGSDGSLLATAAAFADAGRDAAQGAAASVGPSLVELGTQIRRVVIVVHRLGAALGVE
jgi:hypothetical protein